MGVYEPQEGQYEKGYFCELFSPESGDNEFRVGKHIDVGYQLIDSVVYNWQPNTYYYMRLNVTDNQIKAKVWAEGETEPSAWTIETTDEDWKEGLIGIGNFNEQGIRYYDFIGIGWLGNHAPKEDFNV